MRIILNKQLDTEVYLAFHDAVVGGADFGKKIAQDHPNISLENYSHYIDPSIQKAIGAEELLFYPALKTKFEHLRGVWQQRLGAEEFIMASMRYLQ